MKMNVALTADELQNVLDAAANEALNNGLLYDDNEDDMSCLFAVVDAALSAIGIEIVEDDSDIEEPEEEEDIEECDPIEEMVYIKNGERTISKANATMLLDMVAEAIMADESIPNDRKWEVTQIVFLQFAKEHGLDYVDMEGE